MPRRRTLTLTADQINALRRGDDRGGQPRKWGEIAAETGFSASYLAKTAKSWTAPVREPLLIDPRNYEPALAQMSDEDVAKWQAQPTCLCGCGQPTMIETGHNMRVPRGAYRLFRRNHFRKLPYYIEHWREANRTPERIATIRATHAAHMEVAQEVRERIWMWVHSDISHSITALSDLTGLTKGRLHAIGQRQYTQRLTAARIYAAIGEPMTADMAREYTAWLKKEHRDGPAPILQARSEAHEQ